MSMQFEVGSHYKNEKTGKKVVCLNVTDERVFFRSLDKVQGTHDIHKFVIHLCQAKNYKPMVGNSDE